MRGRAPAICDTSILVGYIFGERQAEEAIRTVMDKCHYFVNSDRIWGETHGRINEKGMKFLWSKFSEIREMMLNKQWGRVSERELAVEEIGIDVPKEDEHVVKAAVIAKRETDRSVYLIHKNPRSFDPIKKDLKDKGIIAISAESYVSN